MELRLIQGVARVILYGGLGYFFFIYLGMWDKFPSLPEKLQYLVMLTCGLAVLDTVQAFRK